MADEQVKVQLITPLFRMNFPKLLVAEKPKVKGQANPIFSMGTIFDQESLAKFKQANEDGTFKDVSIVDVCKDLTVRKWPGQKPADIFRNMKGGTNWPIRKGDDMIAAEQKKDKPRKMDYMQGKYLINVKALENYPPRLAYRDAGKLVTLDRSVEADLKKATKLFSGGSYAIAELSVVAQETQMGNFLTFYMNTVVFKKEGERLGGSSLMDRFDGIDGGDSDHEFGDDAIGGGFGDGDEFNV